MKIIDFSQVAPLVPDGATVAVGGFGSYGCPDYLFDALVQGRRGAGHPQNLTVVAGIGTGDNTDAEIGLNRFCEPGLLGQLYVAHLANCPKLGRMVGGNAFPAFVPPLGVVAHMMRAIAGGKSGVLTTVGLGTFADPRQDGCCANQKARECGRKVVEVVNIGGKEQLFYPAFPVNVALIRATYADMDGTLCFDHEAQTGMELEMALAAHNSGGIVIVQVGRLVKSGTIPPKKARIFHNLVDYVVVAPPEFHHQGYATTAYRPELSGEAVIPTDAIAPLPLDTRKAASRRAAMELEENMVINLGIGMPSCVGSIANEEDIRGITMSLESGPVGGVPVAGVGFAASVNAESIQTLCDTFDFYDGGGLDMTCLGAAEIDSKGNVNVSSFNGRCAGPGGFINISQNTPKVCFLFAFTAGKTDIAVGDGKLTIRADGRPVKFVEKLQQITFSADFARQTGQKVLYITERAVFTLCDEGLELIEIAPGVELEKDILDKMAFRPVISPDLKYMDSRIFTDAVMGIAKAK